MTRKDYVMIAEVLKRSSEGGIFEKPLPIKDLVYRFADKLHQDNPRFDRERFMEACGLDS